MGFKLGDTIENKKGCKGFVFLIYPNINYIAHPERLIGRSIAPNLKHIFEYSNYNTCTTRIVLIEKIKMYKIPLLDEFYLLNKYFFI